ncbi:hypothetical protein JCM10207_001740 [Rhodosporidiobolus poonsookiae]
MADVPSARKRPASPSSSSSSHNPPTASTSSTHVGLIHKAPAGDPTDLNQPQEEQPQPPEQSRLWRWTKIVVGDQWFIIGLGVFIGLAAAFPNVARSHGVLEAQWSIKILCVAIIFFISGLNLPLRNLYLRSYDWKLHLVNNVTSFLLFPTITFAIISCVRAADPTSERFNRWALVGFQVMGVLPTTVSSNVVMTTAAGGDAASTTIEVMLQNLVGTFLSPALLQMYLSSSTWIFGRPVASGGGGLRGLYVAVIKQLVYSVYVPFVVGEAVQFVFPKKTKWALTTFRLSKVGSFCLLLVIWSSFSGAFYENAFEILTGEAVAFIVCTNIFLYILFTLFLFAVCRLIPFPTCHFSNGKLVKDGSGPLFDPEVTIATLFTGAAKGAALGAPIVSILYGGLDGEAQGIVSLPLVMYQGSQVVIGQVTVAVLKAWNQRIKRREEEAREAEAGGARPGEA